MAPESAAAETPRVMIAGANPDPLSLAQLLREIGALEKQVTQRMDAIEKAVAVAHDDLVRAPTDVRVQITALRELMETKLEVHGERFTGVDRQFRDNKTAIDDALKAQKELADEQNRSSAAAVLKAEDRINKQIDQQGALMQSIKSELDSRITDVKDRFTTLQSTGQGRNDQRTEQRDDTKVWMAVAGVVLTLIGLLVGYIARR